MAFHPNRTALLITALTALPCGCERGRNGDDDDAVDGGVSAADGGASEADAGAGEVDGSAGDDLACIVIETGQEGERANAARWPDACPVPFEGETRAFNTEGPGFTTVAFTGGQLSVWDYSECSYCSPTGQPADAAQNGLRCVHQYDCGVDGRCPVRVYIDDATNRWIVEGGEHFGCTAPPGPQDLFPTGDGPCQGVCGSRECGGDGCGGSCGTCGPTETCESGLCRASNTWTPACSECLDACSGLPGCCTGSGCLCEDEC